MSIWKSGVAATTVQGPNKKKKKKKKSSGVEKGVDRYGSM
jgi:hypothetical protein